jgi:hypothetical protein
MTLNEIEKLYGKDGVHIRRVSWGDDIHFMYDAANHIYRYVKSTKPTIVFGGRVGAPLDAKDLVVLDSTQSINKKGNIMSKNYVGKSTIVTVSFFSNGEVPCKCDPELAKTLVEGDKLVVDDLGGYKFCTFVRTIAQDYSEESMRLSNLADIWVVNKLDVSAHEARIRNTERQAFLKTKLEEKKKEMEEYAVLKLLAQEDEEAKRLIEELYGNDFIDTKLIKEN